ncbi:MAG: DUF3783 domain-containing protein [Ruthenibacterium sp.]
MKAHLTQNAAPLALYYNLPSDSAAALCAVLDDFSIAARVISAADLARPVGTLAGVGGKIGTAFVGTPPDAELLLLANFEDALLNQLLDALRAKGVAIGLKAIVTKHNRTWTALALITELLREKAAMPPSILEKQEEKE